GDIGASHAWHVTLDAVVLDTSLAALGSFESATLLAVTGKTFGSIEFQFFFWTRIVMRVMTSQTAKFFPLIAALQKTAADMHLLDLPHCPLRFYSVRRSHKKGNKIGESQTRTKVLAFPVSFHNSNYRLKMTLLANAFARDRVQTLRIHDGVVHSV